MSEVFPLAYRNQASMLATSLNNVLSFIVTLTFLPALNLIHLYGVFLFFSIVCILGCVIIGFLMPETKGKTLEEIQLIFSR